ncbi:tRNA lysidine(34) synthetase TilS [Rhizobium sp. BK176]|uniref:tRNA lysidine(34) synthetase TilS n=1 Tax=Rhizobium sp. BK176 TaxID=2587071 RepID=UPI0021678EDF|nr:tRNA lysidine(34) synthetase TilS [Rhizobium sp. BK176]MCS4089244.1 tRNA(Ile)-lysidine synthetase-like protein [Rhizobium sp. BK176]
MQIKWNQIIAEIRSSSEAYLLAVSGGVDSIFMLHFMAKNSGKPLRVAHFNHGLRDQAVEEEQLLRKTCADLGLECHVGYGEPDRMRAASSLEAEARSQRYRFFSTIKRPEELLMTGHHANDQLETIILRLMRGYPHDKLSMRKFAGSRYRPFLEVPKAAILEQAKRRGYQWMEDASNADSTHERNWVRNELIPEMSKRRNVLKSIVYTSAAAAADFSIDEEDFGDIEPAIAKAPNF